MTQTPVSSSNILLVPRCGNELGKNQKKELNEMEQTVFGAGSVPVRVAAKVYGRDPSWVRAGIIAGWLPIGEATRNGEKITDIKQMDSKYGRISYYISPKLLYAQTGYVWEGK
jgi:hypothetical protein